MKRLAAAVLAITLPPAALAADPVVTVAFTDPSRFSDLSLTLPASARERLALAEELRRHIESEAPRRLPAGTRLAVTITDVDMAGEYRPVGSIGHTELRVVREVYPPRVELAFRLLRPDGTVEHEGSRTLRDAMFLSSSAGARARDPLGYEKALLDRWLEREFPPKR